MGQRLLDRPKRRPGSPARMQAAAVPPATLAVFSTELGWFGLVGAGETVTRLFLGHTSAEQVRSNALSQLQRDAAGTSPPELPLPEEDWHPKLRRAIQDFARGVPTDFADVKIDLGQATPFRQRVLRLARGIGYGRTVTYGELAARAGNRSAARAIGAVMASNPIPIIIPCHRVVASGGSLGGFSAPQGVDLKRRLLEMEAASAR
jgi:methylated-DNA-[protein]-cysteine S-methyltransferase